MICTRCEGTGFLNNHLGPANLLTSEGVPEMDAEQLRQWTICNPSDFQVCDCCGSGGEWYDQPGEHYNTDDPQGPSGPYAYNGGLCECH
uniref:Uncharacterized protein n=1 Tax=viral metagenome TaxID=1070528 RepID=A0A6H2A2P2_9ZZZZ